MLHKIHSKLGIMPMNKCTSEGLKFERGHEVSKATWHSLGSMEYYCTVCDI